MRRRSTSTTTNYPLRSRLLTAKISFNSRVSHVDEVEKCVEETVEKIHRTQIHQEVVCRSPHVSMT